MDSDLGFAVADARRIAAAVRQSSLYAGTAPPVVLVDEAATEKSILEALARMVSQARTEDTIVVSFAGHGLVDGQRMLRLALSSTFPKRVEATALAFERVAAELRRSRARVVVLLDVCHAGLADRAAAATNDGAAMQLATAGGAAMVILQATKGRQFSEETSQGAGGRFSVAFARILTSERAAFDGNGDGAISVSELYRGLKSIVQRESLGRQTPWLSRNEMLGDFDLF
jgi:uncharacterized caspase-like protein